MSVGDLALQELFHVYKNPSQIDQSGTDWIEWVYKLRQNDRRHALEFVEGWSGFRIAVLGSVPPIAATVVGVAWVIMAGDPQTAFTVAGFILTVGTCECDYQITWLALLIRV